MYERDGGSGGGGGRWQDWQPLGKKHAFLIFNIFFFFFTELNLFSSLPSPKLLTAVRCQLSGAEQVAITNVNGYYISIQERVQMICLLKHLH